MTNFARCLTPPAIAQRWGASPEKVVALIKRGELRGFTLSPPGSRRPRWLVDPEEVAAFEERRQAKSPKTPARRKRQPADVIEFYT